MFRCLFFLALVLLPATAFSQQMVEEKEPTNFVSGNLASDVTDTTVTSVIAAQGANVKVYLRSIVVSNSSATATRIDILDGSTVKASIHTAASGGGAVVRFDPPLAGTANTAWRVQCGTSGAAVRATFVGFKAFR